MVVRRLERFENSIGETLKGMVVAPESEGARRGVGFVYLPGIVLGTTAVHGLGLKVGEHLAEAGYTTVLFDQPGVGESEGDFPSGTHEELSTWVAEGGLLDGTIEIVDWTRSRLGLERVALIGHCGGALTAVDCAARHDGVVGVFLISPPPLRREKGEREVERPEVADEYFTLYVRKLFDLEPWKNLITGKTDYRTLATVVRSKLGRAFRSSVGGGGSSQGEAAIEDDGRFNPRLVGSMKRSLELGKKMTVIFGDRDVDMNNFRDFYRFHLDERVPLVVIDDSSHGFTTPEGQNRLTDEILRFATLLED
jgi:pimeloyl-ACP methyl ester carboxylesterase